MAPGGHRIAGHDHYGTIPMMLDMDDIQPGIVGPDPFTGSAVNGIDLFGMFSAEESTARSQLDELSQLIGDRHDEHGMLVERTTVGLTAAGMRAIGVDGALLLSLPTEFVDGGANRWRALGDPEPGSIVEPHWFISTSTVATGSPAEFDASLSTSMQGYIASAHPTFLPADRREAFGYRDGISNPTLVGQPGSPSPVGNGVATPTGWRPLAAGEIIFGYPNELGRRPGPEIAQDLLRNGSMLVWRQIEQHVEAFEALLGEICRAASHTHAEVTCESTRAAIMGRRTDGSIATGPSGSRIDTERWRPGSIVSPTSHIRRMRPRLGAPGLPDDGQHRIIRRSARWNNDVSEGLVFRCYQTSIAQQFEFIQREWANHGNSLGHGRETDLVAGNAAAPAPGDPLGHLAHRVLTAVEVGPDTDAHRAVEHVAVTRRGPHLAAMTTTMSTRYIFVPGRRAIETLAHGGWGRK
jgi:hypothetical protein